MVKFISVKIVVEDGDSKRCSLSCPHFDQQAVASAVVERCRIYHRELAFRRRCDECREAKEL